MLQRNFDQPYPAPDEADRTLSPKAGSSRPSICARWRRILRRRWKMVALPPAVLARAWRWSMSSLRRTLYTATSTVLVDPRRANVVETNQSVLSNFGTDDATIESQTLLIQSVAILRARRATN